MTIKIEWQEKRGKGVEAERFFIVAERVGRHWQFYERGYFEVRWYPTDTTPERVSLAEERSKLPHCQRR